MYVSKPPQRPKKRRSGFPLLFTVVITTTMVATGGFGAFPNNPLTQTFVQVIGDNVPAEFLDPFNSYMENLSAPTIQPQNDSRPDEPFDPIGTLVTQPNGEVPTLQAPNEAEIIDTALASIFETYTALVPTSTITALPTQTLLPTLTITSSPVPSATSAPTITSSPVVVYIQPTRTPKPQLSLTETVFPPTSTITLTPTAVPPEGGSCVAGSPNTSDYGCLISNIRLDGVAQTSMTVTAGQIFTLEYDYQVWTNPDCPGCTMQVLAGMESTPAANCDFDGVPGMYTGSIGTSSIQTLTAPTASGNWVIFFRWTQHPDCATAITNYGGFGMVIARIMVP